MDFNEIRAVVGCLEAREFIKDVLLGEAKQVFKKKEAEFTKAQNNALCSDQTVYIVLTIYGLQKKFGASPAMLQQGLKKHGEDTLELLEIGLGSTRPRIQLSDQTETRVKSTTAIKRVRSKGQELLIPQIILTRLCKKEMSPETCRTRLDLLTDAGLLRRQDGEMVCYALTKNTKRYCAAYLDILRRATCE